MDAIPYKEIIQLGGPTVLALGLIYYLFYFTKEHKAELNASRSERVESYDWFRKYVNENNHEQTDRFKEHTKALVDVTVESTKTMSEVSENIKKNTEVTQKTLEILDNHSKVLEKIVEEIRFKLK